MHIESNRSLLEFNTFKMKVNADYFLEYQTVEELREFILKNPHAEKPVLHIGQGSNLLFLNDYHGTVLHSGLKAIELVDETADMVRIRVESGVIWDDLVAYCVDREWYGIENLSLIPGETGAAAVQNIGAYGVELKDVIESVVAVSLENAETRIFSRSECVYGYRESIFKQDLKGKFVITEIYLLLSKKESYILNYGNLKYQLSAPGMLTLKNLRRVIIDTRNSKLPDPEVVGNAGSFFMNPIIELEQFEKLHHANPAMPYYLLENNSYKLPAGWLIDQCGWKGKSIGNAGVHIDQALVLVNLGDATPDELVYLAAEIQQDVVTKFGVLLQPEVNYIKS